MGDQGLFILKLLLLSAALSVAIKYLAPLINIPATAEIALSFVLSPTLLLGGLLLWRGQQKPK